jgi:hypothetical protein
MVGGEVESLLVVGGGWWAVNGEVVFGCWLLGVGSGGCCLVCECLNSAEGEIKMLKVVLLKVES